MLGAAFIQRRDPGLSLGIGWASHGIGEMCRQHLPAPVTPSGAHRAVCADVRDSGYVLSIALMIPAVSSALFCAATRAAMPVLRSAAVPVP